MNATDTIDVAIIGSGPAGLTAGIYAARAGRQAVVFESLVAGGQMGTTDKVDNYPGFPEGVGGFELAFAMKQQADRFGVHTESVNITGVDFSSSPKRLFTDSGEYRAHTVIVASGARSRQLGVQGEQSLRGRGVSYCATCDGNFFAGKSVIVVGGANTAVEDALYLANICEKVTIVYRKDRVRATAIYTEAAESSEAISFMYRSVVDSFIVDEGKVIGCKIRNLDTDAVTDVAANGVFVAIGNVPNSEFLNGALALDEGGYIVADESCATSVPGVFVAGDIRTKSLRQVVTAVADGAVAAEAACGLLMTES